MAVPPVEMLPELHKGLAVSLPADLEEEQGILAALDADEFTYATSGNAPFGLEIDEGLGFEINNLGVIRLRLRSHGLPNGCAALVTIKAGAEFRLKEQELVLLAGLRMGETRLLPVWQCHPSVAGNVPLELGVEVLNAASDSLGRWQASHVVKVSKGESARQINIHGDVLDLGTGGLGQMLTGSGQPGGEKWRPILFYPDEVWQSRQHRAIPSWKMEPPLVEIDPGHGPLWTGSWLRLHGLGPLHYQQAAVFWGTQVPMGRKLNEKEPDAGTHLRVNADNLDPTERRRMSGTHCHLRLHRGKAWVQDVSGNGTWLNGDKLAKNQWHLLVPGDLLSLRKVANFKVHLQADAEGVIALCLAQQVTGGSSQNFVLAARSLFWPAAGVAAWPQSGGALDGVWFCEQPAPGGRRLFALAPGESAWSALDATGPVLEKCGWQIVPGANLAA